MATGTDIRSMLMDRLGKGAGGAAPAAPDDGGQGVDPLGDALQEFAAAMQSGDIEAMKTAFQAAFQVCEMGPHMEAGEQG